MKVEKNTLGEGKPIRSKKQKRNKIADKKLKKQKVKPKRKDKKKKKNINWKMK